MLHCISFTHVSGGDGHPYAEKGFPRQHCPYTRLRSPPSSNYRALYLCDKLVLWQSRPKGLVHTFGILENSVHPLFLAAMSLPQFKKDTKKESKRPLAQRAQAAFKNAITSLLSLLLPILIFPYYSAFMRNTLNAIDAIRDEPDPSVKNDLIHRFIQFKINESKYVQVAVSGVYTHVPSCSTATGNGSRTRTVFLIYYHVHVHI